MCQMLKALLKVNLCLGCQSQTVIMKYSDAKAKSFRPRFYLSPSASNLYCTEVRSHLAVITKGHSHGWNANSFKRKEYLIK